MLWHRRDRSPKTLPEEGLNEAFGVAVDDQAIEHATPAYIAVFSLDNERQPAAWLVHAADETRLPRAVLQVGADETLAPARRDGDLEKLSNDDRSWYFARFGEWTLYTNSDEVPSRPWPRCYDGGLPIQ